jgi:hypothetical protein
MALLSGRRNRMLDNHMIERMADDTVFLFPYTKNNRNMARDTETGCRLPKSLSLYQVYMINHLLFPVRAGKRLANIPYFRYNAGHGRIEDRHLQLEISLLGGTGVFPRGKGR